MVEISRVLRPGGVFVASTFLKTFSPLGELFGDDAVRPLNQVQHVLQLTAFMPLSFRQTVTDSVSHILQYLLHGTSDNWSSHMFQYITGAYCMTMLKEFGTCKPRRSICSYLLREACHTGGGRNRSSET